MDVLGVDRNAETVQTLHQHLTYVVTADATQEDALTELGIGEFEHAVVSFGTELEASILTTSLLLRLGVPHVWVRAVSDAHEHILVQLGVPHIISPEKETGRRVAHLIQDHVVDYAALEGGYAIVTVTVPRSWIGRRLGEINLRGRRGLAVAAVRRASGEWVLAEPYLEILEGDTAIVIGPEKAASQLLTMDT